MITLVNTLEVQRTPEEVFTFLVTVENAPKWQPAVIETRRLTEGPVRVGTQYREVARMMGRRVETVCEITELESPRTFAFRATSTGPFSYETRYVLEAIGASTRISIRGTFRLKGLWRLLEPFVRGEVQKESAQELVAMKAAIERAAPATGSTTAP